MPLKRSASRELTHQLLRQEQILQTEQREQQLMGLGYRNFMAMQPPQLLRLLHQVVQANQAGAFSVDMCLSLLEVILARLDELEKKA